MADVLSDAVGVRIVRAEEWAQYRALRLRALAGDPRAFGARLDEEEAQPEAFWRARLDDPLSRTFVAGDWQGLCTLRLPAPPAPSPFPRAPVAAEIHGMWVAPELRGRGAGRALIDAALAEARAQGAKAASLWVNVEQKEAARLYERCGFVAQGEPMRGTRDPTRVFQRMERVLD